MNSVGKCSLCAYVGNNTHIHYIIPRSRMRRILFKWLNSDFEYAKLLNDGVDCE